MNKDKSPRKKGGRRQSGQPTISDVANLAQCSPMTVSRVINGEDSVRKSTRDKVLVAIEQLNYSPNRAARSLAGASQIRIALLYTNPSASYLSELLMGCLDEASKSDVHLVVERCAFGEDEEKVVRNLIKSGIGGFLLPPPLCDEQPLLELIEELGGKAILVGPGKAQPHQSAVMIDEYQAAFDMTTHIIGLGHKRIGFIIGNPYQTASGQRLSGFLDGMAAANLSVPESMVRQGLFTYRSGIDAAMYLLDQTDRPTAIFASNDDMAAAVVSVAQRRHLDVPLDLSVCGFDDTTIASTIWPELTTIRQPIQEMARHALEILAEQMRSARTGKSSKPVHLKIDYTLMRRQSDGAPGLARSAIRKDN
ncbi:LacI family DNA-binding transcriptional regulator [Altererythrobacter indicus]|uniref:LacI family DNA-binding transcriptional regulator n=1 Tax=Altericroceibacterium indicum TaxID=374177 RepID=A0A845A7P8_9SPHN|nr:LacI family DNA-binding transcriptional regulator [Altericroceibacterium indicum]MXP26250.1 LacI family DNA-binding transcriptional regulator [Altericroceibacterium indicum]